MAYRIEINPACYKDMEALSKGIFVRVSQKIRTLAANPRPTGSKKLSGSDNTYRIRVGDYRVLYEIHDKVLVIVVVRVKHRREAYRR